MSLSMVELSPTGKLRLGALHYAKGQVGTRGKFANEEESLGWVMQSRVAGGVELLHRRPEVGMSTAKTSLTG